MLSIIMIQINTCNTKKITRLVYLMDRNMAVYVYMILAVFSAR